MAQKKLTNAWDGTLHLELSPDERGLGATHISLGKGEEVVVEEGRLSEQVLVLAGQAGGRKKKRQKVSLVISDIDVVEKKAEEELIVEVIAEPMPEEPKKYTDLDLHGKTKAELQEIAKELSVDPDQSKSDLVAAILEASK